METMKDRRSPKDLSRHARSPPILMRVDRQNQNLSQSCQSGRLMSPRLSHHPNPQ